MKPDFLLNILSTKAKAAELAHFYTVTSNDNQQSIQDFINNLLLKIIDKKEVTSITNHPDILEVSTSANNYTLAHDDFTDFFDFLRSRPLSLKQKIVIIQDAHKVNKIIWNKLLKTLEEPEVAVAIFLLNPNKVNILETITSRTINIALDAKINKPAPGFSFLKSLKDSDHFTDRAFLDFLKTNSIAKLLLDMKAKDFNEDLFVGHWIRVANELALDHKQYSDIIQALEHYKEYKDFNNSQTYRLVYISAMLKDHIQAIN